MSFNVESKQYFWGDLLSMIARLLCYLSNLVMAGVFFISEKTVTIIFEAIIFMHLLTAGEFFVLRSIE